jgi:hypothetical protein
LVATFAPLALLLVLALLATWTRPSRDADARALPATALERARSHCEATSWRSLLLAHRLATGRWAADLDEVGAWAAAPQLALTRSERGAYYVGHRAEGPIVLAPEP